MVRVLQRLRSSTRRRRLPGVADTRGDADRMLAEIRELTDRNRLQRDRAIERQLVELRHQAFRQITASHSRPDPVDGVEDLFPGELIPEISRDELTVETLRSGIGRHGSLLVRGLVTSEQVELLKADIDKAFDAFDAHASATRVDDLVGWYQPFEHRMITDEDRTRKRSRGNILAFESPPTLFDLIETMNDSGVGELARGHLGERPAVLARKVTLRRIPHNFGGGWHQDGAFMGRDIHSLNVWLSLSHCGDDAPGLDVVGSRVDELLPTGDGAYAAWGIKPENAELTGEGAIVRPLFEAGDALLFDHMCLHRTGTDAGMTKGRYAIETWFMAPSTYGQMSAKVKNGYSPRDQVPLVF
jgi:Phytanoyl-CoA dioxygenase (PhyH)